MKNTIMFDEIPESITVTIPKQEFDSDKYIGVLNGRCYLEDALDKTEYKNSSVSCCGWTDFNWNGQIYHYEPVEDFDSGVLRRELPNKDVTVILKFKNISQ